MSYLRFIVLAAVAVAVLGVEKRGGCTSTNTDCSSVTCPHGEHAVCEQVHGTGVGGGEYSCVCKHNGRSVRATHGCCSAADCDANALGCDPHHQTVTCELKTQHGDSCHDNTCKCIQKHNG